MTFVKGQSGNPGGRPKGFTDFKRECEQRSARALELLDDAIGLGPSPVAIEAAKLLLAYAWGKPTQIVDVKGDLNLTITKVLEEARQRAAIQSAVDITNAMQGKQ